MHEIVLAENKKLRGRLRDHDVCIISSPFVPVEHCFVEEEMARFMTLINHGADQFPRLKENPVEFAALVHFIFVRFLGI
jgi:Fic family protein